MCATAARGSEGLGFGFGEEVAPKNNCFHVFDALRALPFVSQTTLGRYPRHRRLQKPKQVPAPTPREHDVSKTESRVISDVTCRNKQLIYTKQAASLKLQTVGCNATTLTSAKNPHPC